MAHERARVDELHIRVPGLTAEEGSRFGAEVARRVADGLSPGGGRKVVSELDIRVTVPAGTDRTRLAEAVARRILESLR